MGIEIERKFLVFKHKLPDLQHGQRMIQGYLSEKPSVRYRIINNMMIITVKEYITGGERFELETPSKEITLAEIEKLQQLSVCVPVMKVRYRLPYQGDAGLIWEIDVYEGDNQGLITVDIEIPQHDYPLVFPPWVDSDNDVTEDRRYSNINLGKWPYSRWEF